MITDFEEQLAQKSTTELVHIYVNSDDYQERYVQLVFAELARRNYDLTEAQLKRAGKQAVKDEVMEQGRPGNSFYIALGFIAAFMGGFIGIIAGYIYSQSKHKDNPRGRFYVYNQQTRQLGLAMMVLGILVMAYTVLNNFY